MGNILAMIGVTPVLLQGYSAAILDVQGIRCFELPLSGKSLEEAAE
jgi:hypothetical protein